MPETTILFVDNDIRVLNRRSKWLEESGYKVLAASNIPNARELLGNDQHIDLAILDVRMTPNEPKGDESGFYLAGETTSSNIPTIILTAFPEYELVRRAQTWFPDGTPAHVNFVDKKESKQVFLQVVTGSLRGRNIFITHGHKREARDQVKLFVTELGLTPVVLQDQPNRGLTVFQKFEAYANVAYVVALVTADDIGNAKGSPPDRLKFRARQNVIFELGYFMGKFPHKVAILMEEGDKTPGIELPSDIAGFAYIGMRPDEQWKRELVQEIRSSGLNVIW